jgi:hypothetical protein
MGSSSSTQRGSGRRPGRPVISKPKYIASTTLGPYANSARHGFWDLGKISASPKPPPRLNKALPHIPLPPPVRPSPQPTYTRFPTTQMPTRRPVPDRHPVPVAPHMPTTQVPARRPVPVAPLRIPNAPPKLPRMPFQSPVAAPKFPPLSAIGRPAPPWAGRTSALSPAHPVVLHGRR